MQAVLSYIYSGVAQVAEEDLPSFLAVAEDLKIEGMIKNFETVHPLDLDDKTKVQDTKENIAEYEKETEDESQSLDYSENCILKVDNITIPMKEREDDSSNEIEEFLAKYFHNRETNKAFFEIKSQD